MTALSDFLRRNRLDDTFLRRLGYAAAVGSVTVGIVAAAALGSANETTAPSTASGTEIAEELTPHVDRTADRLEDMKAIHRALRDDPALMMPGRSATGKLISIANALYANTPHPELAKSDITRFRSDFRIADHSTAADAVAAVNAQKLKLAEATRALDGVVKALGNGSRLHEAVERFDTAVSRMDTQSVGSIRLSLDQLRADDGAIQNIR